MKNRVCLEQYSIESSSFPGQNGYIFTDYTKSRRVCIISKCNKSDSMPSHDAILLHEINNCPESGCKIQWYECPTQAGRTYTLFPTGCDVVITSFENGLLLEKECDGRAYGSQNYCFGKIYSGENNIYIHDSSSLCVTIFDFDGHTFRVEGQPAVSSGIFECGECELVSDIKISDTLLFSSFTQPSLQDFISEDNSNIVSMFGGDIILPNDPGGNAGSSSSGTDNINDTSEDTTSPGNLVDVPPATPGEIGDEDAEPIVGTPINEEDRVIWSPWGSGVGEDVSCVTEVQAISNNKSQCESQNNPSIVVLPSGHAAIAYEERDEDGSNRIKIAILGTSVVNKVIYYRSLSRGTLLNKDVADTFEIFDDIVVDSFPSLLIGFLTGPLKGNANDQGPFNVLSISQSTDSATGKRKYTIVFDVGNRVAVFPDSNHVSDVVWFLSTTSSGDAGAGIDTVINLPDHLDASGTAVQVSNPSISTANNNLMVSSDQYIYLTYQAFENKQWNVYLRQIRLSDKTTSTPPVYLAPYNTENKLLYPSGIRNPNAQETETLAGTLKYTQVQFDQDANGKYYLFSVSTEDDRPVYDNTAVAGDITFNNISGQHDGKLAWVVVRYVYTTECSVFNSPALSHNTNGFWGLGEVPPLEEDICSIGEGGSNGHFCGGAPAGCLQIEAVPDTSSWSTSVAEFCESSVVLSDDFTGNNGDSVDLDKWIILDVVSGAQFVDGVHIICDNVFTMCNCPIVDNCGGNLTAISSLVFKQSIDIVDPIHVSMSSSIKWNWATTSHASGPKFSFIMRSDLKPLFDVFSNPASRYLIDLQILSGNLSIKMIRELPGNSGQVDSINIDQNLLPDGVWNDLKIEMVNENSDSSEVIWVRANIFINGNLEASLLDNNIDANGNTPIVSSVDDTFYYGFSLQTSLSSGISNHFLVDSIQLNTVTNVACEDPYADPYAAVGDIDPYFDTTYKAEDLWLLKTGDNFITRVKYHMSITATRQVFTDNTITTTETISDLLVDFVFIIDYSATTSDEILKIKVALPVFAQSMADLGWDVRFGFIIQARGTFFASPPPPADAVIYSDISNSNNSIFNALQDTACSPSCGTGSSNMVVGDDVIGGFTRNLDLLNQALCCWTNTTGLTAPWAAIQYAVTNSDSVNSPLLWRSGSARFIMLMTDAGNETSPGLLIGGYPNNRASAESALSDNGVILISFNCNPSDPCTGSGSGQYDGLSNGSGWAGDDRYSINASSYEDVFEQIVSGIELSSTTTGFSGFLPVPISGLRLLERDKHGTDSTHMWNAETIITYSGDLSDNWTQDKKVFTFVDKLPLLDADPGKGLTNLPFELHNNKIYGIDPVFRRGTLVNWSYYTSSGVVQIDYPNFGDLTTIVDNPILISRNSTSPVVSINNRNEIFVAYENYEVGYPQIEISGTGDLCQDSITGPKGSRTVKLATVNDFNFSHAITLPEESVNQLCDFVIDDSDVIHIVWQSNRDTVWEIYYANSFDIFEPVRVTNADSRSSIPKVDIDKDGNIYVVYHDNRFGPYEIMLSYKDERRILPLLQQDPYLASVRADYKHYTNTLPLVLTYTTDTRALWSQLYGSIPSITQKATAKYTVVQIDSNTNGYNVLFSVTDSNNVPIINMDLPGGNISFDGIDGEYDADRAWLVLKHNFKSGCTSDNSPVFVIGMFGILSVTPSVEELNTISSVGGSGNTISAPECIDITPFPIASKWSIDGLDILTSIETSGNLSTVSGNTIYSIAALAGTDNILYGFTHDKRLIEATSQTEERLIDPNIIQKGFLDILPPWSPGTNIQSDQFINDSQTLQLIDPKWTLSIGNDNIYILRKAHICENELSLSHVCPITDDTGGLTKETFVYLSSTTTPVYSADVTIRSEVRWPSSSEFTGAFGPSIMFIFRAQNTTGNGSNIPFPCYFVHIKPRITNGVKETFAILWRAKDTLSGSGGVIWQAIQPDSGWSNAIDQFRFFNDQYTKIQIDCFNEDFSSTEQQVKINMYFNDIQVSGWTHNSSTGSASGFEPILNNNSLLFYYGFSVQSEIGQFASPPVDPNIGGNSLIFTHFVLKNINIETLSQRAGTSFIADATSDSSKKLWALVGQTDLSNQNSLRLMNINPLNANILSDTSIFSDLSNLDGAVIADNNNFYLVVYVNSVPKFYKSPYPSISAQGTIFSFTEINGNMSARIRSMSIDRDGTIIGLDYNNILYEINPNDGETILISVLSGISDPYDPYNPYEISSAPPVSSIGHLLGGGEFVGDAKFFRVIIEFYDNINLERDPILVIDSRDQLEAFVSDTTDPYLPSATQFTSASGLFMSPLTTSIVFFDASHFRPEHQLSYPYSLDTNRTYFPRAFLAGLTSNDLIETKQNSSFSCNKCTLSGDNIFDSHGCSYSFVVENTNLTSDLSISLIVDFFADIEKQSLIRRFVLSNNHSDLTYMEVNNRPAAISDFTDEGLVIPSGSSSLIQIYPSLDPSSGFICGIIYHVDVNECTSSACTGFISSGSIDTRKMYWLSSASQNFTSGGQSTSSTNTLYSANKDGSNKIKLFEISQSTTGSNAIHVGNNQFYWFTDNVGLNRINLDGTGLTTVISTKHGSGGTIVQSSGIEIDPNQISAISIDEINNRLYFWVQEKSTGAISAWPIHISSSNIDGGDIENIYNTTLGSCSSTESQICNSLQSKIDSKHGELYFHTFSGSLIDRLVKLNIESNLIIDLDVFQGSNSVTSFDIDLVNNYVYYTNSSGLHKSSFDATSTQTIITSIEDEPITNVNLDIISGKVYFIYQGFITRSNLNGSDIERLVPIVESDISFFFVERITSSAIIGGGLSILLLSSQFKCECSSNIFANKILPLNQISRWHSSAHGYADTRVTDSPQKNTNPSIKTRSSGSAIILFEDYENDIPHIKGATFRKSNFNQLFGSGSRSWFDYDFQITGKSEDLAVDLFDRVVVSFEKPDSVAGKGLSETELTGNTIFFKNCDFSEVSSIGDTIAPEACDISKLETNTITSDPFISSHLIKRVLVKGDAVEYYTYNSAGQSVPVVFTCNITLQVWATPESVAIRFRNENEPNFGGWCPFDPQISDYYIERKWRLSSTTGIKEVCMQVMTYSGITSEFCVPIIADYTPVVYQTNLYSDAEYTTLLPTYSGMFVASAKTETGSNTPKSSETIYVEIIPVSNIDTDSIKYNVIKQGDDDVVGFDAVKTNRSSDGRVVFRGNFTINREDNVTFKDGLARIVAQFPTECGTDTITTNISVFNKDKYNLTTQLEEIQISDFSDALSDFRQPVSGRVGTGIVLHPTEDPYFVFGDPSFYLVQKDPESVGVPQSGVLVTGEIPDIEQPPDEEEPPTEEPPTEEPPTEEPPTEEPPTEEPPAEEPPPENCVPCDGTVTEVEETQIWP